MLNRKLQRGVTLFEMLLVLVIISLITVAAIRYADRKRDESVADVLAQKLYEYGHAAREFAYDHQAELEAGDADFTGPFEGVAWLQPDRAGRNQTGEPYLDENFTFTENLSPLYLGNFDGTPGTAADNTDETIVYTSLVWDDTENRPLVKILIGGLYDVAGIDDNGDQIIKAMPDITAAAATKASNYYDPIRGFAAIDYAIDLDVFTGRGGAYVIIGGLATTSAESEAYLRTDGRNYMKNDITFVDADEHGTVTEAEDNYGIRNLEYIEFDDNDVTTISNLQNLEFTGEESAITGMGSITFDNDNPNGNTVFKGFRVNSSIHTVRAERVPTYTTLPGIGPVPVGVKNVSASTAGIASTKNSFCFINGIQMDPAPDQGKNTEYSCYIGISGNGDFNMFAYIRSANAHYDDYIQCQARCIDFNF